MRSNLTNYRKRVKLGIIGALVFCHIAFFVARKFEFISEIKQDNRPEQASFVVINIKPPPPKPPEPPPLLPEPIVPKKPVLRAPGPIVPVSDSLEDVPDPPPLLEPSPAPGPFIPFIPRDKEPELIGDLNLSYPDWARKIGMEGKTFVHALVNIDGTVVEAKIFKSSGYEILDEAAIQAVKKSHWRPAEQGDEPVSVWIIVPVKFELHK